MLDKEVGIVASVYICLSISRLQPDALTDCDDFLHGFCLFQGQARYVNGFFPFLMQSQFVV